jgi:hypothetical protein
MIFVALDALGVELQKNFEAQKTHSNDQKT